MRSANWCATPMATTSHASASNPAPCWTTMPVASPMRRSGCWKTRVRWQRILVLEDAEGGALLLDNLAVAPNAQGKGHGRTLVAFAEAEARRRGHAEIRLYTHVLMAENLAIYGRLGFAETHRVTEKGYDRVYMMKRLA